MSTLTGPAPELARDRFGRPMVIPPEGGKAVAYTRCTTYIDCIEDKYNLQKWMQRMVALGLASRPDLVLSAAAHREDKTHLDQVCDAAREAAAANAAATTGTALHSLTQIIDEGGKLPDGLPANVRASLNAYVEATSELRATHIERFTVLDTLKIGGTPDRVVAYKRGRYIADLKTGSIEYGVLKIAMQLAVYARSHLYDIATGARSNHDADLARGLIIHLPAVEDPADAMCRLIWVDLVQGWDGVAVARRVREKRTLKFRDIATPFAPDAPMLPFADAVPDAKPADPSPSPPPGTPPSLAEQIEQAPDTDTLHMLWKANSAVWDDNLTTLAKLRIALLRSE